MQDMARKYLAILFMFVETAVHVVADGEQGYVEQDFRMGDAFNDPHYSSIVAAHEGYRVFTNIPGQGLTESLTLTHSDGLYVAGEKVITEREHRRLVSELESVQTQLESFRTTFETFQPLECGPPGGEKLQYIGGQWHCVCLEGFQGTSCQFGLTGAPTTGAPTSAWTEILTPDPRGGACRGAGGNYAMYEMATIELCKSACLSDVRCLAIEYCEENNLCELWFGVPTYIEYKGAGWTGGCYLVTNRQP